MVLIMMVKDYSFLCTTTSLLSAMLLKLLLQGKAQLKLERDRDGIKEQNKERQRERGGRDGNGKKDEVSPMGEACPDLLNPSNLLHLLSSFLHHLSFQGEIKKGEQA